MKIHSTVNVTLLLKKYVQIVPKTAYIFALRYTAFLNNNCCKLYSPNLKDKRR